MPGVVCMLWEIIIFEIKAWRDCFPQTRFMRCARWNGPILNYSWWFVVCGAGGIWEGRLISRGHNYFRCNSFQNIWPSAEWSQHRQYLNCYTQFNNPRRDMRGNKIWNQIEKSRFCDSFTYFCKSRVKYCNWESVSGLQMGIRRAH